MLVLLQINTCSNTPANLLCVIVCRLKGLRENLYVCLGLLKIKRTKTFWVHSLVHTA
jgi:hypothetical protein